MTVLLAILGSAGGMLEAANTPDNWTSGFPLNTSDGPLASLVVANGQLWAGGSFTAIGTITASNIAFWNTNVWLPAGAGFNGPVDALTTNAAGTIVYAGGAFTGSGTTVLNAIAQWNGTAWSGLGTGMSGGSGGTSVSQLALGVSGSIIAAGSFTSAGGVSALNIAQWNGTSWSALGAGLASPPLALAVDGSGNVFVPDPANHTVQEFSGVSWSDLPAISGDNGVTALAIDANGDVLAAASTGQVYELQSGTWITLAGGPGGIGFPVTAMLVTSDNALLATTNGGTFNWTGSAWTQIDPGQGTGAHLLASDSSSTVYRANTQQQHLVSPASSTDQISVLIGSQWFSTTIGLDNDVGSVVVDASGAAYIAGEVSSLDIPNSGFVVLKLAGSTTTQLGAVFTDQPQVLSVGSNSTLTLGLSSTTSALRSWNGSAWTTLGTGLAGTVLALASDADGHVFFGGDALASRSTSFNDIGEWTGSTLQPLGSGLDGDALSMACDVGGLLHVVGRFTHAGGVAAPGYAMWNGSTWIVPSTGTIVPTVLGSDGRGTVYGTDGTQVIQWSGTAWSTVAPAPGSGVRCLAANSTGQIYAGGTFSGGAEVFSGGAWQILGTGTNGPELALAPTPGGVFAGGAFTLADGAPSGFLGFYSNSGGSGSASGTGVSITSPTSLGGASAGVPEHTAASSYTTGHCGVGGALGLVLALAGLTGWRQRRRG